MTEYKEYGLVDDLGFVKTGVNEFINKRKYYSTGSVKDKSLKVKGEYSFNNRPSRANREVQEGDVLQARMENTNKVVLIDKNLNGSLFSTGFFQFRPPKELILPKFLYYYLYSDFFNKKKDSLCDGATQKAINDKNLRKIKLFLPSLSEQQRIVAKLDATYAEIDKTINNTKKIISSHKDFLNSILEDFFNSKDNKLFKKKELGEIIEVLTDYHANGSYKKLKDNITLKNEKDYAWMVRSTDFEKNFKNDLRYINKNSYNYLSKSKIFGGEIIMSKIGNAGKIYLVPKLSMPASLAMNLFLIRIKNKLAIDKYVFFYLSSRGGKNQIHSRIKGATTQTITKENVRNIKIPICSMENQIKFIKKNEEIQKKNKILINILEKKMNALSNLKSSIFSLFFKNNSQTTL